MRIGPGAAPGASLYAIKIFGCTGGTALTAEGLDRVLDPDGDGDFDDRLDVVNLSLGAPHGAVDDPVNDFVTALTANGVLVVAAAGNTGDVYDSGGAPGSSPDALAVASVRDPGVLLDAVEVAGLAPLVGDYSVDYPAYADARPHAAGRGARRGPAGLRAVRTGGGRAGPRRSRLAGVAATIPARARADPCRGRPTRPRPGPQACCWPPDAPNPDRAASPATTGCRCSA